jgi:hypothetical protein
MSRPYNNANRIQSAMNAESIKAIVILIVVPVLGFAGYLWLAATMLWRKTPYAPYGSYFIIFGGYGALLVMALAVVLQLWPPALTLLLIGVLTVGLFFMAMVAYINHKDARLSGYHRWARNLALVFLGLGLLLWLLGFM